MSSPIQFTGRDEFRNWLIAHGQSSAGIWLLFGKPGGPETIKAGEALEEALCFGWIDGQIQRIDKTSYKKYFSPRRENSKWSEKNRKLAQRLDRRPDAEHRRNPLPEVFFHAPGEQQVVGKEQGIGQPP